MHHKKIHKHTLLKFSIHGIIVLGVAVLLQGCVQYKNIPYFKDIPSDGGTSEISNSYTDPVIQKNDILKVTVSSLDPDVTRLFSFNSEDKNQGNSNSAGSSYLVDPEGYIRMPLIGAVKVEGQTTWGIRDTITKLLEPFLKETVVEIRIISFRITVMGDVGRPGIYSVQNERMTLPEALTLAGDLNITARRDNIMLIREINGERKYVRFDMRESDVFTSPYIYLRSNDVVYVQPGPVSTRDVNFRNLTYLATFLSLIALIASLVK
jgi:polysaccharide export outer membrane protein